LAAKSAPFIADLAILQTSDSVCKQNTTSIF